MSKVAVIGCGYVGLATAATLSHLGHHVVAAEVNPDRLVLLREGRSPILEDGLEDLLREGLAKGTLEFVDDAAIAAEGAEFAFLCVQTPMSDDGRADLTWVEAAVREIGPVLERGAIVVTKSTVPVGSSRVVGRVLHREDVSVVSNPEFLQEGAAVHDSLHPSRIVIGSDDQAAAIRVAGLFEEIQAPLVITDPASAETIKYASNSFLAMKVSFVNAVAALSEAVGADVADVVVGMGYDHRIGAEFLKPGPGWGGSCFPKDVRAMRAIADDAGYDFHLLDAVIAVNDEQFDRVVDKIEQGAGGTLDGATVAVWGLTFKARTADVRESPSIEIVRRLVAKGATIRAYDPTVIAPLDGITVVGDAYEACAGADVLAVLTEWDEFRWLDFDRVAEAMAGRSVVDGRNLLESAALRRLGFEYQGIGR
ncbi:MAG TPA: UDP-glucose/GDP-mannose dehydrogenase family protein [Acidimicrobiales bacterium]|nr:UDP-glucose/GDP-mannose dehydrogenase family protein [Acidimicrobiales bacterium]